MNQQGTNYQQIVENLEKELKNDSNYLEKMIQSSFEVAADERHINDLIELNEQVRFYHEITMGKKVEIKSEDSSSLEDKRSQDEEQVEGLYTFI